MTSFVQALFFRNQFVGEGTRGLCLRTNAAPCSVAFFCPRCGEIWARLVIGQEPWMVKHVDCEQCGKLGVINFPGSLWSPFDQDLNNALPYQWLARELEIAIAWHQRYGRHAP